MAANRRRILFAALGVVLCNCGNDAAEPPAPEPPAPEVAAAAEQGTPTAPEEPPPEPPAPENADPTETETEATPTVGRVGGPLEWGPIDDETGTPPIDPALAGVDRLGPGAFYDDPSTAFGAGMLDSEETMFGVEAEVTVGHRQHALVAVTESEAEGHDNPELSTLWYALLEVRETDEGPAYRRLGAIRLYGGAMVSEPMGYDVDCNVESEVRARDLDGDGETEATVIAGYLTPWGRSWQGGGRPEECGAVAFLIGEDLNIQAQFSREYAFAGFAASIEVFASITTAWRIRDIDGDGHPDLRVTERWRFDDHFMGDYIGGGETAGPDRTRGSDSRVLECLWQDASDRWVCADGATPGQFLFTDPEQRRYDARPW